MEIYMKKCGAWLVGVALLLAGCDITTHRTLHSDTTLTTARQKAAVLDTSTPICPLDTVVWQGTLTEDQSVLSLCTTASGYRLHRRYADGTVVYEDAAAYDVGREHSTVGGGFWFRTSTSHHSVMEGTETAIYEVDQEVPNQGFLPQFISGVAVSDGRHINRTRTRL